MNENRQKILGVKSNKSNFFVNEGSNKLSEKKEQDNVSVESTKVVADVSKQLSDKATTHRRKKFYGRSKSSQSLLQYAGKDSAGKHE